VQKITTFLMFDGKAEEAMSFYMSLFADSEIKSITRDEAAGTVQHAVFALNGQLFMCIDTSVRHGFAFTPAMSLHVTCETEAEVDKLFAALSQDGQVLMPLNTYPFSRKYAWLNDRFGVSWQLALVDA
jgi:predicted 3-demethylubiquinone-9 3-methyltransferase (glyoxalase superfamily)